MTNARAFLGEQIASYERQLRQAEAKRADFRAKYLELLPAVSGTSGLDQARSDLRRLSGELADAQARRLVLGQELAATAATVSSRPQNVPSRPRGRGRARPTTLTDQHPDVIRQQELVETLRHGGGGGPGRPARSRSEPNMVYQQLKVMLVTSDSDISSLTRQVADARSECARLERIARDVPTVQVQSSNLNRDYDVLRKNYEELLARRESMRLSDAADTEADKVKVEVIDPPQVPQIPVSPRRPLLLSFVLLAGLGSGVGSVLLLGRLDRSFRSIKDLRALGYAVAGSISLLAVTSGRRSGRVGIAGAFVAVGLLCLAYGGLIYRSLNIPGQA